jgi:SpoU rRNA Methylase family
MDSSDSLRDERRRRFQAKQERMVSGSSNTEIRDGLSCEDHAWRLSHSALCTVVDITHVTSIRERMAKINPTHSPAPVAQSESEILLLEKLLHPYFDLCSKIIPSSRMDHRRRFIAEGTETIRLLIQQSQNESSDPIHRKPVEIESIFLKPNLFFEEPVCLFKDVDQALHQMVDQNPRATTPFHILLGSEAVITSVAGFPVSRGCLACGYVPTHMDENWLCGFVKSRLHAVNNFSIRLLALDGVSDTANLGSIIRTASALGVHAIILSEDSCDAWYRRTIRVSMGHIFRIPVVRAANLEQTLLKLMGPPFQVTSYAGIAEATAKFLLHNLQPGTCG